MSTHAVNVIEISEVRAHENAERLEIVPVGGWQAVVKKGDFRPGDRAVYIQPDYSIPTTRPEFSFLAREGRERHRLRAVRLRGVLSFGLLIPLPAELADAPVGADVMEALGIERYVPAVQSGADTLPPEERPNVYAPTFDVESLQNFPDVLIPGEQVIVTEKIHGANARYLYSEGKFFVGSRTRWIQPDGTHVWKRALDAHPEIRAWCETHEGTILFGEVFGNVQSLKYGRENSVAFAAFAALDADIWISLPVLRDTLAAHGVPMAPVLYQGPWNANEILPLAELDSAIDGAPAGHMREGIVIATYPERRDDAVGRVALKHISARYWTGDAE